MLIPIQHFCWKSIIYAQTDTSFCWQRIICAETDTEFCWKRIIYARTDTAVLLKTYNLCSDWYSILLTTYNLCSDRYSILLTTYNLCSDRYSILLATYNLCSDRYIILLKTYNLCSDRYSITITVRCTATELNTFYSSTAGLIFPQLLQRWPSHIQPCRKHQTGVLLQSEDLRKSAPFILSIALGTAVQLLLQLCPVKHWRSKDQIVDMQSSSLSSG